MSYTTKCHQNYVKCHQNYVKCHQNYDLNATKTTIQMPPKLRVFKSEIGSNATKTTNFDIASKSIGTKTTANNIHIFCLKQAKITTEMSCFCKN